MSRSCFLSTNVILMFRCSRYVAMYRINGRWIWLVHSPLQASGSSCLIYFWHYLALLNSRLGFYFVAHPAVLLRVNKNSLVAFWCLLSKNRFVATTKIKRVLHILKTGSCRH